MLIFAMANLHRANLPIIQMEYKIACSYLANHTCFLPWQINFTYPGKLILYPMANSLYTPWQIHFLFQVLFVVQAHGTLFVYTLAIIFTHTMTNHGKFTAYTLTTIFLHIPWQSLFACNIIIFYCTYHAKSFFPFL